MKYIIMADGKGTRWNNYGNTTKHLYEINGESLLARTVRLLRENNVSDIIITSHNPKYEIDGAKRYEPKNNVLEIDRFTYELIEDDVCFLYGDTFYTEESIKLIVDTSVDEIKFFGNSNSIVAIKVADGNLFKKHVDNVRKKFLNKEIKKCIGWQVYQSYMGYEFESKYIGDNYIVVDDKTININSYKDL